MTYLQEVIKSKYSTANEPRRHADTPNNGRGQQQPQGIAQSQPIFGSGTGRGLKSFQTNNPFDRSVGPRQVSSDMSTTAPRGNPFSGGARTNNPFGNNSTSTTTSQFGSSGSPFGGARQPMHAAEIPRPFMGSTNPRDGALHFGQQQGGVPSFGQPARHQAEASAPDMQNTPMFSRASVPTFGHGDTPRGPPQGTASFQCRVCQQSFPSFPDMKAHIKAENHYNTATRPAAGGDYDASDFPPPGARERVTAAPASAPQCRVCKQTFSSFQEMKAHIRAENHFEGATIPPTRTTSGPPAKDPAAINRFRNSSLPVAPDSAHFEQDDEDHADHKAVMEQSLREKLLKEKTKPVTTAPMKPPPAQAIKAVPSREVPPPKAALSIKAPVPAAPPARKPAVPKRPVQVVADQTVGQCLDMCPREERTRRVGESDVHKLEMLHDDAPGLPASLRFTMIKKLQRSSADHELKIPHLMRTPRTLMNTVFYMENSVMEKDLEGPDPRFNDEEPPEIDVYLFVWDRFRMIAKDFILQLDSNDTSIHSIGEAGADLKFLLRHGVLGWDQETVEERLYIDKLCIECHERMARWHIMMEHHMAHNDEFNSVHKQQNGEQLFRLLKSLDEWYFGSTVASWSGLHGPPLNIAEFCCYYIIYQIDNGKEVALYIRGLPKDILDSDSVKFAIQVWTARKTNNYALFFKLLYYASYLQACCMYRYVGNMRFLALKTMARTYRAGKIEAYHPIVEMMQSLMFEDEEDVGEFLEHCGVEVVDGPEEEDGLCAVLVGQSIEDNLPVDKNGFMIYPRTRQLLNGIESKIDGMGRKEVCRGINNEASLFTLNCDEVDGDDDDEADTDRGYQPPPAGSGKHSSDAKSNSARAAKFPGASSMRDSSKLATQRVIDLTEDDDADDDNEGDDDAAEDEDDADNIAISDVESEAGSEASMDAGAAAESDISALDSATPVLKLPPSLARSVSSGKPPVPIEASKLPPHPSPIGKAPADIPRSPRLKLDYPLPGSKLDIASPPRLPSPGVTIRREDFFKPESYSNSADSPKITTWTTNPQLNIPPMVLPGPVQLHTQDASQVQVPTSITSALVQTSVPAVVPSVDAVPAPTPEVDYARLALEQHLKQQEEQRVRDLREKRIHEFRNRQMLKTERRMKVSCFRSWHFSTLKSIKTSRNNIARLYLCVWKKVWIRRVLRRTNFIDAIASIDISTGRASLYDESSAVSVINTRRRCHASTPFPEPLEWPLLEEVAASVRQSIEPTSLPQLLGPLLLSIQNDFIVSRTPSAAKWTRSLFWKCAIFSGIGSSGVWNHHEESIGANLLRAMLCTDATAPGCIGMWREDVICTHSEALKRTQHSASVAIVDIGNRTHPSCSTAKGLSATIIIVNVSDTGDFSSSALDIYVSTLAAANTLPPLVLLLIKEELGAEETHCEWDDAYNSPLVNDIMAYLSSSLQRQLTLHGALLWTLALPTSTLHLEFPADFIESTQSVLQELLLVAASYAAPLPLIQKLNLMFEWETEVNECIWNADESPGWSESDKFVDAIHRINFTTNRLLATVEATIQAGGDLCEEFPSPEFAVDSLVGGALYEDMGTGGRGLHALPLDWFNGDVLLEVRDELLALLLPPWNFQSSASNADVAHDYCERLVQAGWTLPARLGALLGDMIDDGQWRRALTLLVTSKARDCKTANAPVCLLHELQFDPQPSRIYISIVPPKMRLADASVLSKRTTSSAEERSSEVIKRAKFSPSSPTDDLEALESAIRSRIKAPPRLLVADYDVLDEINAEQEREANLERILREALDPSYSSQPKDKRFLSRDAVDTSALLSVDEVMGYIGRCREERNSFDKRWSEQGVTSSGSS